MNTPWLSWSIERTYHKSTLYWNCTVTPLFHLMVWWMADDHSSSWLESPTLSTLLKLSLIESQVITYSKHTESCHDIYFGFLGENLHNVFRGCDFCRESCHASHVSLFQPLLSINTINCLKVNVTLSLYDLRPIVEDTETNQIGHCPRQALETAFEQRNHCMFTIRSLTAFFMNTERSHILFTLQQY